MAPQVAPKRAALAAAQETLNATLADLQSAQERLQAVEQKIATLEAQFAEATAKKASLAAQVGAGHRLCTNQSLCCTRQLRCFAAHSSIRIAFQECGR
jgi:predicted  nucleic acid-binding Zn-ribbon protein